MGSAEVAEALRLSDLHGGLLERTEQLVLASGLPVGSGRLQQLAERHQLLQGEEKPVLRIRIFLVFYPDPRLLKLAYFYPFCAAKCYEN
jgi:hypothetical protein